MALFALNQHRIGHLDAKRGEARRRDKTAFSAFLLHRAAAARRACSTDAFRQLGPVGAFADYVLPHNNEPHIQGMKALANDLTESTREQSEGHGPTRPTTSTVPQQSNKFAVVKHTPTYNSLTIIMQT